MNLKNLDLKNIFSKSKEPQSDFPNLSMKAAHDWKMILLIFFVLMFVVVGLNLLLFIKISEGEAFGKNISSGSEEATIDISSLGGIVSSFEEKEKRTELIIEESTASIDPSL